MGLLAGVAFGRLARFIAEARGREDPQAGEADVAVLGGEVRGERGFGAEEMFVYKGFRDQVAEVGVRPLDGEEGGVGGVREDLEKELVGEGEERKN